MSYSILIGSSIKGRTIHKTSEIIKQESFSSAFNLNNQFPRVNPYPKLIPFFRFHDEAAALRFFEDHRNELLKYYNEKFVLICGTQLVEIYDRYHDALSDGLRRFGEIGFLIRKITPRSKLLDLSIEFR